MTGAQFEIRIDGTPRSYRDRKDYAMEAARLIKSKNPHSLSYGFGAATLLLASQWPSLHPRCIRVFELQPVRPD